MGSILSLQRLDKRHVNAVKEAAPDWELIDGSDRETARKHLADSDIVLGWNSLVRELVLSGTARLKWVQNWGAGVERLPLERFRELGIALTNASGVHPYPISEQIFAMLLSYTRGVHTAIRDQENAVWGRVAAPLGEAHGKTMGIVGVGAIGSETARLAKAFRMNVLGVRRSGDPDKWVDDMFGLGGLNEVLSRSDYVVNCLPHTKETEHLIGREQFAAMKRGAFYINIGRGMTTDTDALMEALKDGTIGGAGLDVFEQEPLPADHPLWSMKNVVITPHTAGINEKYTDRVIDIFTANLRLFVQGKPPEISAVNLAEEY